MNNKELSVNTIRIIGNEAINKASSGHPGMVLGSACVSYCLFNHHLNITSRDSKWINRDRFVLGSGHASMLLYTNLHLLGYKVCIEDIKNFRQLGSNTPGHPEYGVTDGVDCSSGPLGQGIGHAVGMAISEKYLAERFNKDDLKLFDNYTYCLCGDGDNEEGVSFEAYSIAGRLNLNKLIVIYDKNDITLDGPLEYSSNEDFAKRMEALKWNVIECNGLEFDEIDDAIKKAKSYPSKPTIIIAHTTIGYLSTNQGTNKVHGAPIKEDLDNVKAKINWSYAPFEIPNEVYEDYKIGKERGSKAYDKWNEVLEEYKIKYPLDYKVLNDAINHANLLNLDYPKFELDTNEATRASFGKIINHIGKQVELLLGGAADVAGSVNTLLKEDKIFGLEEHGRNIYYGIREHAMSLIQSGILLYGLIRPYVGSFMVFSDFFKPSIRTAALMHLPSINILTHDSIAVGEDGPTHQPIEQINSLRLIPNTYNFRPSGAIETMHSVRFSLENTKNPSNLILSRQNMSIPKDVSYEEFIKGAYIVKDYLDYDYVLITTGSEVELAIKTTLLLETKNIKVRVVSMPCMELFERQDNKFKESIIGNDRDKVIALEMGSKGLWYKYASKVYGIDCFGESGKASDVMNHFGFNPETIAKFILE